MPHYRLTYFQAKARAEISRLIFAAAGQEYENRRVQEFTCPDYTKVYFLKPEEQINTEEWLQLKKELPFEQVPVLEVDGQMIAQSKVIATFLARRFGLAGKTDLDDAKAAMIAETVNDEFQDKTFMLFVETDKEKQKAGIQQYESETIPRVMTKLEKLVGEKGFFVADQLSYADIAFYFNSEWPSFLQIKIEWDKFPKLKAVVEHVKSNPGIAKHLKERPNDVF